MKKLISRCLVWTMIFILSGFSLVSLPAQVEASSAVVKSGPSISAPRFSSPDLSQTYTDGQKVRIDVNYGQAGFKVTADLSVVDSEMSKSFQVLDNKTGTYTLITPILSGETLQMVTEKAIVFTATDKSGTAVSTASTYLVNTKLKRLKDGASINAPARLTAKAQDAKVTIWWSKMSTDKILVRYNDKQGLERRVVISNNNTGVTIDNLINGYEYNFQMSGLANSGTYGKVKSIKVKPNGPESVDSLIDATKVFQNSKGLKSINGQAVSIVNLDENTVKTETLSKQVETKIVEVPENKNIGEASSVTTGKDQGEPKSNNWKNLIMAVSILLIAAGAAIGGYYGYEWLISQKVLKNKKVKIDKPVKDAKNQNSRW